MADTTTADQRAASQLVSYLTDVHSIEEQALAQLRRAPGVAGSDELAAPYVEHLAETEGHERLVRELLEARDEGTSTIKDVVGKATGVGFALFAEAQPDTPGKLAAHAYSYEHLELAAYDLLARIAELLGAGDVAVEARKIRDEERAMAARIADRFDDAVDASLDQLDPGDLAEQVVKYLADAHAIEMQSLALLERGADIAGSAELEDVLTEHLDETRDHEARVRARLEALDASPSSIKDAALHLGALNWSAFFAAQPDTPAKLAGFAFAVEHLEAAAYEELARVARRANDAGTAEMAESILASERAAAEQVLESFDAAVDASLRAQGIPRTSAPETGAP